MISDLINKEYKPINAKYKYGEDFLRDRENKEFNCDIVTNPPYKYAEMFVRQSLKLVKEGRYVCMFLKLTFAESQSRKKLFDEFPPIRIWVSSSRINCPKNADFSDKTSSAVCYSWYVWQKGYYGPTEFKWFN